MQKQDVINFIRTVPLFHSFSPEQISELAEAAEIRDVAKDEVVVERDSEGDELFIIVEGEFEAYLRDEEMDFERSLSRFLPGKHFGEIAVLTGQRRTASIRALEPGRAIVLRRETIENLLDRSRDFRHALFRAMGRYLSEGISSLSAIPYSRLDAYEDLRSHVGLLPPRICRFCRALPVERTDDRVTVAMVNPSDIRARSFVGNVLKQYRVQFVAVSEKDFQRHATMLLDVAKVDGGDTTDLAYYNPSGQRIELAPVGSDDLLPRVIAAAIRSGASDIHIEPSENTGRVRLRIDGKMLVLEDQIDREAIRQLVSRIKVISELDITNIRRPQDGRFMIEASDRRIEYRVSATPCLGGEKMVLRVLARTPTLMDLDNLILSESVASFAHDITEYPSGLILVTGPTGAGKTTTLYAALHAIESRDRTINIVTIEDPVEYNLPFATQIQVDRELKLDFANILRTVLRQDPDVILVGEIRDEESAEIALEAATTGHLVLSSLHTHSAVDSIVRLRDLGVEPYLLASALKGLISQKLVPRLCPGCTEPVPDDDPSIEDLRELGILDGDFSGKLLRGVDGEGCPPGGESGRVGVFEVLSVDDRLRDAIDHNAPTSDLKKQLDDDSFVSFARYSRFLLSQGLVAPERIARIFPKRRRSNATSTV